MDSLQVGDRVRWHNERGIWYGEVLDFDTITDTKVAVVMVFNCDGEVVPLALRDLTVVTIDEVMIALQFATPAPLPAAGATAGVAGLVDDYELMVGLAGDLGGAEL